jgi:hypothetical protein
MASTKNPLHRLFGLDIASHGDNTTKKFDKTKNLEVISFGLSRTGTTSLQIALEKLDYGPVHGGIDLFRSETRTNSFIDLYSKVISGVWKAGDPVLSARLRELMSGYRSVTDIPIAYIVPETFAAYPNAKYILTVRPGGKEEWWPSFWVAGNYNFRTDFWRYFYRVLIYPVSFIRRTDDKVVLLGELLRQRYGAIDANIYDKHSAGVKRIVPPEQLLVFDVRQGWEPLCKFLGKDVPAEAFPRLNDSQAQNAIYVGMMAFGASVWAFHFSVAAALGYVAMKPEIAKTYLDAFTGWVAGTASKMGIR